MRGILSQCVHISHHHIVHLKHLTVLVVSYTSIMAECMGNKVTSPSMHALLFKFEGFSHPLLLDGVKIAKNLTYILAADSIHVFNLYREVFYHFITFTLITHSFPAHIGYQPSN